MRPHTSSEHLTILHTNDFHGRLTSTRATAIARLFEAAVAPKLLLDAGDAGASTNVTFRSSGEPVLEEMSNLGYAAMTVGNRDFHVSRGGFRAKLFRARFPILCANIRPTRVVSDNAKEQAPSMPLAQSVSDAEPDIRSYAHYSLPPNWSVLVFGLTVPMVTERMWERKLSAYVFDNPLRTAAKLVPALRDCLQPNITIALTHIGLRLDRELAASVPGIDLIIGGHSHDLLPEGERVDDTLVVQAGSHARHIGIVDVFRANSGRPVLQARLVDL